MKSPKLLLLNDADEETSKLMDLLAEYALLIRVLDQSEVREALMSEDFDALLCAWKYRAGNWRDAMEIARGIAPDLPIIVFARAGGEREWLEVIQAGAFDLLATPYCTRTVLPVLEQAMQSREARRIYQHAV